MRKKKQRDSETGERKIQGNKLRQGDKDKKTERHIETDIECEV